MHWFLLTVILSIPFVVCTKVQTQDEMFELLVALKGEVSILRSEMNKLQGTVDELAAENRYLKTEVQDQKDKRSTLDLVAETNNKTTIAFYVTKQESGLIGLHQTIEFENVHENTGNGYDKRHGHFTAPLTGLYFFAATIYSNPNADIKCELVKNGVHLSSLYAPRPGSASSTMNVVVRLSVGDVVWVRHSSSATQSLNANNYSAFTGFLIS